MQVTITSCSFCNKVEIIKWFRRLTGAVFGSPFPLRTCVQIMKQLDDGGNKLVFDVPDTDAVRKVLDEEDFYNVTFTDHPSGWIDLVAVKTSVDADREMER